MGNPHNNELRNRRSDLQSDHRRGQLEVLSSDPGHRTNNKTSRKEAVRCRFFLTKKGIPVSLVASIYFHHAAEMRMIYTIGCRAGNDCPYLHVSEEGTSSNTQDNSTNNGPSSSSKASPSGEDPSLSHGMQGLTVDQGDRPSTESSNRRMLQGPISKAEEHDPREFQLNQLRRRFRPTEQTDEHRTVLTFKMIPSDPDFPFELESLHCTLFVPKTYPSKQRPTLKVTNPQMDRRYQRNVEMGFDDLADTSLRNGKKASLLGWMNGLDRHLEEFLSVAERGPTLKFVANVWEPEMGHEKQKEPKKEASEREKETPSPMYTVQEKVQAEKRRDMETRQLEARLGRSPLFRKHALDGGGLAFTIPLRPAKLDRIPPPLRSLEVVTLLVPLLYPLEPSCVELQGVDREAARPVEAFFAQLIRGNPDLNLMSQINYLASNMHTFSNKPLSKDVPDLPTTTTATTSEQQQQGPVTQQERKNDELYDRSHLHVIPRPPEWNTSAAGDKSDQDDEDIATSNVSSSAEDEDEFSDDDGQEGHRAVPAAIPENQISGRGVALSFPSLELYGIELLVLANLWVTVRCDRCKEAIDINNARQAVSTGDEVKYAPKNESCKKCANSMSIGGFLFFS